VLKEALATHPEDGDILLALATISRDAGNLASALEYAERLDRLMPADPDISKLVQTLRDLEKKAR
jgi:cytochrome c-type biogenesis protein CcmH/NrfG